jgi:energy-coupling factor transport system ATP-binding protein
VALTASELVVRLPSESFPVLERAELALGEGEVVGLTGRSGAGKTTLLHALSGLVPWLRPAEVHGRVTLDGEAIDDLDPGQRAHLLSTCLDRPEAQLFLHTPRQELAAVRRLGRETPMIERVIEELALEPLLDRRILELSSGERQRVAVASALALSPRPVLLDEPTAHLDGVAAQALGRLLERIRQEAGAVLLCEQAGWRLQGSVSRWLRLAHGAVTPGPDPEVPAIPIREHEPGERIVLRTRGLEVRRGARRLLGGVDLELRAGEIVLVSGNNGVGKSAFARVLAGLERAAAGRVEHEGAGRPVVLMLPDPELQLFAPTVAEELSGRGVAAAEVARVLRRHQLEHLAARAPWSLSRGERQRLTHAALDLLRPSVMIVDEPAQGLDPDDLVQLVNLILRRAEKGRAYLIISHREELARAAHRHLEIAGGELIELEGGP